MIATSLLFPEHVPLAAWSPKKVVVVFAVAWSNHQDGSENGEDNGTRIWRKIFTMMHLNDKDASWRVVTFTWDKACNQLKFPALRSFIYQDVREPTCHPCSTTGMMQDYHLFQLWATWDIFILAGLLCRQEEVLSVPRISSFWKRSVSLRFLGVFLLVVCFVWLCLCFGVVLFRHWEDIWLFAFHLFSYNVRIADRPQDVLMTVRASCVHGMS